MTSTSPDYTPLTSVNLTGNGTSPAEPEIEWIYLLLGVVPIWVVVGNLLVVMAVARTKQLHTVTNWSIMSLALTDAGVGILVIPMAIYLLMCGNKWRLGHTLCLIWFSSDVTLCTASIMHLAGIAVTRYLSLARPLAIQRGTRGCGIPSYIIITAWSCGFVIAFTLLIQEHTDHVDMGDDVAQPGRSYVFDSTHEQCILDDKNYAIYGSIFAFFLPLGLTLMAELRAIQLLRKRLNTKRHSTPNTPSRAASSASERKSIKQFKKEKGGKGTRTSLVLRLLDGNAAGPSRSGRKKPEDEISSDLSDTFVPPRLSLQSNTSLEFHQNGVISRVETRDDFENSSASQRSLVRHLRSFPSYSNSLDGDFADFEKDCHSSAPLAPCESTFSLLESARASPMHAVTLPMNNTNDNLPTIIEHLNNCDTNAPYRELPRQQKRLSSVVTFKEENNLRLPKMKQISSFLYDAKRKQNSVASTKSHRERLMLKRQRRAERTLLLVLLFFIGGWAPFFSTNLLSGICPSCVNPELFGIFTWIGWLSSGINPCLYTIFDGEFRKAIKKIVRNPFNNNCRS